MKISVGTEVMKTLEGIFFAPVGQVLSLWSAKERNGEDDWVLGEAGRYAFKYGPFSAIGEELIKSGSSLDFASGIGQRRGAFNPKKTCIE